MNHYFDPYAEKGNEFLDILSDHLLVTDDIPRSVRVLRSVLHALRDNLPVEVSLQFMAQLPMVVKALYVEGWKTPPSKMKPVKQADDFIQAVMQKENSLLAAHDFIDADGAAAAIHAVFRTIAYYVSEGEWEDVLHVLPENLQSFLRSGAKENFLIL